MASRSRWMVCKGAFYSALLIRFLEWLVRSINGRKVYLMLDHLSVHHSKPVKAWLEEPQAASTVYAPPSYSPELNREQHLNRALKSTPNVSAHSSHQAQLSMPLDVLSLCRNNSIAVFGSS